LPALVFDPESLMDEVGGRPIFRPTKDTVLLHLGHPMFRHALAAFARARYRNASQYVPSRWTCRIGEVSDGADMVVHLTVEELGVNALREPFHHWVRTIRLPVTGGGIGAPLPHRPPTALRAEGHGAGEDVVAAVQGLWFDLQQPLERWIANYRASLTEQMRDALAAVRETALEAEAHRYEDRLHEVRDAMKNTTLKRLERERDKLEAELRQGMLTEEMTRERSLALANLDDELRRRQNHFSDLQSYLERDQKRVLREVLPRRYELRGEVQVFPVGVEIRVPAP
jgi:hypothetical protein